MDVKITKDGKLLIKRKGEYQQQYCPFAAKYYCGDWCPQFGEIKKERIYSSPNYTDQTTLELCQGKKLIIDNYEDNRNEMQK